MEGQTADGADPLSHEAVIVFDVADHVPVGVVDGDELVHGAARRVMRKKEEDNSVENGSQMSQPSEDVFHLSNMEIELATTGSRGRTQWSCRRAK